MHHIHLHTHRRILFIIGLLCLLLAPTTTKQTTAQSGESLHPTFALLDAAGNHVVESGQPLSTQQTCGQCHDTVFIESHSFHADIGLSDWTEAGQLPNSSPWDSSPGWFGRWNPLTYRYLSPVDDTHIDLTTPEWLQLLGNRHVGGGPGVYGRNGIPLTDIDITDGDPETHIVNPETGELVPWNWQASGIVEMNCFLCHFDSPNNEARIGALATGEFSWVNSATLLGSGIIEQVDSSWQWNATAFDDAGHLLAEYVNIQDPTNAHCAQCHGTIHSDLQTPLVTDNCQLDQWSTSTTGQIYSPQHLSQSGTNLAGKTNLNRAWDIHAERVIACTDCHYALNNPVYYQESDETKPDHLRFDPRRIDLSEYLYRPLHEFAKGQSAQGLVAPGLDNSLRRCESCHDMATTHDWLPYKERHTQALSCETCHIPKLYAPAHQSIDWTVLQRDGKPISSCRGQEGDADTIKTLVTGYEPVLLPRQNGDGTTSLAPHNLITAWYWVYGDPARPVPLRHLEAIWSIDGTINPDMLTLFDANGDYNIQGNERLLDSEAKVTFMANALKEQGLDNPRIAGDIRPYSINHNVTHGQWATKACRACHGEESRITQGIKLASYIPGGVLPQPLPSTTLMLGELILTDEGSLYYQPQTQTIGEGTSLYVLGLDAVDWIDWLGAWLFLGTWLGVVIHGGLRYFLARRRTTTATPALQEVYMYTVYERLWHWLQTAVILLLLFTGLIIHKPDQFGLFSFRYMVQIHNILAFILLGNALLALFYHLASGEIQQFLPRPQGFFSRAIEQMLFYVRGIFRQEEHPFTKTPQRKLNPLQQITYFAILNILLPLQVITGLLMWGVQHWPNLAAQAGGLPFLAPFHTLVAWLFASFIVMHVYLTTTGHTPLTNMRAMVMGWDEVTAHEAVAD